MLNDDFIYCFEPRATKLLSDYGYRQQSKCEPRLKINGQKPSRWYFQQIEDHKQQTEAGYPVSTAHC